MRFFFALILGLLSISMYFADTVGDRVLQAREARLRQVSDPLAPTGSRALRSSLANVSNVEGEIGIQNPEDGGNLISLLDAVRRTLQTNLQIKSAQLRVENKKKAVRLATQFQKPRLDWNFGFHKAGNFGEDSRSDFHRQLADLSHLEDVFHLGLDFEYPLLDGGASVGKQDIAKLHAKLQDLKKRETEQNLLLEVSEVFISLILAREKLDVSTLEVEKARFVVAREEQNPTRDNRMPADLLKARLELERALHNEFLHRNELRNYEARLRTLIGLAEGEEFNIDKNARTRAVESTLDGLLKISQSENLQLQMIEVQKEVYRKQTKVIQAPKMPAVDIFAGSHYARLMDRSDLDEMRFNLGIRFDMNFLDGGQTRTRHEINNQSKEIAENDETGHQRRVRDDVQFYYNQFLDFQGRVPIARNHVKLARQVLYEAEERFQKRILSNEELLDHRMSYKQAVLGYYRLLKDLMLTKLRLFASVGRLNLDVFN